MRGRNSARLWRSFIGIASSAFAAAIVSDFCGYFIAMAAYGDIYPVEAYAEGFVFSFLSLLAIGLVIFLPVHWLLRSVWPSAAAYVLAGALLGCGFAFALFWRLGDWIGAAVDASASSDFLQVWHPVIEVGVWCAVTMMAFGLVFWSIRRPDRDLPAAGAAPLN